MLKYLLIILFSLHLLSVNAQSVEVQADYNAIGDCIFSAYNNSGVPMYLHLNFGDLQNTSFSEPLPYVKRLTPGFNQLFTLERDLDADVPRFHYEIKSFRSNPTANVNLDFPYLIPFSEGKKVKAFDVKNIDGFWGATGLKHWSAIGFVAQPTDDVFAIRNGVIVEIVGANRSGNAQSWYNTWTNSITVLQPDGTLLCYHKVSVPTGKLKVGQKIYAGQLLGKIAQGSSNLIILIYHDSITTKDKLFVIPQFVISEGKTGIVNSATEYTVTHPIDVKGLEMSKKEKRKILGARR